MFSGTSYGIAYSIVTTAICKGSVTTLYPLIKNCISSLTCFQTNFFSLQSFLEQAKASGKKPQKVALKVSPQGIVLYDSLTNKLLENVSIYRYVQSSIRFVDKWHLQ